MLGQAARRRGPARLRLLPLAPPWVVGGRVCGVDCAARGAQPSGEIRDEACGNFRDALFILRQRQRPGHLSDRRPCRLYLRRMRRAVRGYHQPGQGRGHRRRPAAIAPGVIGPGTERSRFRSPGARHPRFRAIRRSRRCDPPTDFVLVTNNASDFRSLYAAKDLHPGLVALA